MYWIESQITTEITYSYIQALLQVWDKLSNDLVLVTVPVGVLVVVVVEVHAVFGEAHVVDQRREGHQAEQVGLVFGLSQQQLLMRRRRL